MRQYKKSTLCMLCILAMFMGNYVHKNYFNSISYDEWLVKRDGKLPKITINEQRLNRLLRILYEQEYDSKFNQEIGVISLKDISKESNNSMNNLFKKEINRYFDVMENSLPIVNDKFITTLKGISTQVLQSNNFHNNSKIVIVSAADSFYYGRVLATIKSVHEHFPDNEFVIYNLGMTSSMTDKVLRNCKCSIRALHSIHLKNFPHLNNLKNYAWKPMIIADALKHSNQIMYIDASIRFNTSDASELVHKSQLTGVVASYIGFRLPCFTHPQTFKWFGESALDFNLFGTIEGNFLIWNKNFLTALILKAWVGCALDEKCISPKGARLKPCCGCHKFDQVVLTIINSFFFPQQSDYSFVNNLYEIRRHDPLKYF